MTAPHGATARAAAVAVAARAAIVLALAGAVLGFVPTLLDPFAVPKADLVALLGVPALAAALVLARRERFVPLDGAIAAWCAVSLLATFAGIAPRLSWLGEIGQREGLRTTLALAGLYAAARTARATRLAHATWLVAASLAATYALIQCSGHDPLAWGRQAFYPGAHGAFVLRPGSTLGNANLLGVVLATALALACARVVLGRGERAWLVPAIAVLATATVATLSRGALLAAACGVLAALALSWPRRSAGAPGRAALALGSALLPALAWSAIVLRAPLAARAAEGLGGESSPARLEFARGVLALLREHPLLGVGPDAFGLAFPRVMSPALWRTEWLGLPAHAHAVPLQVLATLGVAGSLAGLAWLALVGRELVREVRMDGERGEGATEASAMLVALGAASLVNPVGLAGAALFAVTSGALASTADVAANAPPSRTRLRLAWLAVGVVAVLAVAPSPWPGLAHGANARGALERMVGAPAAARFALARFADAEGARALAGAPGEDEIARLACDAALAHAGAAEAAGATDEARTARTDAERAARRALALQPRRASNHQRLANAFAARARAEDAPALDGAADAAFARAEALAPADALVLVDAVRAQLLAHRWDDAATTAARIVALYPRAATGHALAAAALAAGGHDADALAACDRALAARWEDGAEAQRAATLALRNRLAGRAR